MSEHRSWAKYVNAYAQGDKQGVIADKMGVQSSTVGHWLTGKTQQPSASQAINFARIYGRSVVEALIHAEYIDPNEVGEVIEVAGSADDLSDAALVEALAGRLKTLRGRLIRNDTQDWSGFRGASENPGVGRVQDGD